MTPPFHRPRWRTIVAAAALLVGGGAASAAGSGPPAAPASASPTPQLVNGDLVPADQQRTLGLVTVAGGCSGTLLNRFWVLTADHCVTTDGTIGGPSAPLSTLGVRARWSTQRATPTKVVRYFQSRGKDMALMFLGAGDLGEVPVQALYQKRPTAAGGSPSIVYRAYGRGIYQLAQVDDNGLVTPSESDGRYRTADYLAEFASTDLFRVKPNARHQIGSPGDSGGPYFAVRNGRIQGVIGVHSSSVKTYAPGKPRESDWVTDITRATAHAVYELRSEIQNTIREGFEPCPGVSAGCAAIDASALTLLLN